MSKTYTPGPWKAVMENVVSDNHYICDCKTTKDYSIDAANARLIAAAPDLLEIVEHLGEMFSAGADVIYAESIVMGDDDTTLAEHVFNAITKAKGEIS